MSIYDVVEIAEWRRKNMFCLYCIHYVSLDEPCRKDKNINDIRAVVNCEHYKYDGSLEDFVDVDYSDVATDIGYCTNLLEQRRERLQKRGRYQ